MDAILYSDMRKNLKKHLDHVYNSHEPLIIARRNNKNVVLISIEDFNSLHETNYLLSSRTNAERLLSSLENARSGKLGEKELIEE